jgi:predicted porin
MKKFALLAVLAGISAAASAQSSVTLFGVLDEAARYTKTDTAKLRQLASGGINTSRFGVRGIEDLGGGLKAGFWLESGLNANSGQTSENSSNYSTQGTRFWNRRSTVSLISDTIGELRLGRDFTPTYTGYTDYDAFGDNGVAASSKFDSSFAAPGQTVGTGATGGLRDTGTRADNQIMYLTPGNLGGFYGRAAVASANAVAGRRYYGGRAGYAAGPLDVSASYGVTYVAPVAGNDRFKVADVGASYDFGVVKAMAYYTQSKLANQKNATYSIQGIVPIGLGQLKAAYTHLNASGFTGAANTALSNRNGDDANQYAVGYVYNLSKRTAVYGTAAIVRNKGAATFAVAGSPPVTGGQKSEGAEVGIRHAF